MPDASPFLPAIEKLASGSAIENLGVIRSCSAAHKAFLAAVAEGKPDATALSEGAEAYRRALPPLDTEQNIRDFISGVTHVRHAHPDHRSRRSSPPPLRRPVRRRRGAQTLTKVLVLESLILIPGF